MSEEPKTAPEKKKSKLPVIIALVAVLAAGGFFGMKMKGGEPKKVEVKAGETIALDKEFLVNLSGGGDNYLRAELAVELREGFSKEAFDKDLPQIRHAINQVLRSRTLQQVGPNATNDLRKEISRDVNRILISHMDAEGKKHQKECEEAAKKSGEQGEAKDGAEKPRDDGAGPVLNVYFTSFTTQ